MRVLITAKADVTVSNHNRESPLTLLSCRPFAENTWALLLEAKADINHQDANGFTPLMGAVHAGSSEGQAGALAVKFCLNRGAQLHLEDHSQVSATSLAAQLGKLPALQTLLNHPSAHPLHVPMLGRRGVYSHRA